jgi:uncharacterized OB-fold protein
MLHYVDCGSADAIQIGSRVAPRWRSERTGYMTDIEAWEPLGDGEEPTPAPLHAPAEDEQPVTEIRVPVSLTFVNTAGISTARYLEGMGEGKIIGARAPGSTEVYAGSRGTDPTTGEPTSIEVEGANFARRRRQHVLRTDPGLSGRGRAHGHAGESQVGRRIEARPHVDPLVRTDR